MVEGRSKQAVKQWLAARPTAWRQGLEVVAMDGFTGYKTAAAEEVPDAVAVMDPFHVTRLAGDALDLCRRRVQQDTCGHRGRKTDPLYAARRTLHTGSDLLTDKQKQRLDVLFAADEQVQVEATWGIYQRMIAAYREPDRTRGRELMRKLINSVSHGVPAALTEVISLGRTLNKASRRHLGLLTGPAPATARPRRSTAASNTYAARPSASATSPTTSPDHYWRPADSDPDYTLHCEEPDWLANRRRGYPGFGTTN
jgi:transposase